MAGFREIKSPNFWDNRSGYRPESIVIHITDGSAQSTIHTFQNPASKVSAHYLVTQKGEVISFVEETSSAWHCGTVSAPTWQLLKKDVNPNLYTIGIEFESRNIGPLTWQQIFIGAWLISNVSQRWGIPLSDPYILGHREINAGKECPGKYVNVAALAWLAVSFGEKA